MYTSANTIADRKIAAAVDKVTTKSVWETQSAGDSPARTTDTPCNDSGDVNAYVDASCSTEAMTRLLCSDTTVRLRSGLNARYVTPGHVHLDERAMT